jgi:hypothetical protein
MSDCSVMLNTPFRPKRSLEYNDGCRDMDEQNSISGSVPSHKKLCVEPLSANRSSLASQKIPSTPPAHSNTGTASSTTTYSRKEKELNDESDENMDVSDDIVSNFNTISFKSSCHENSPVVPQTPVRPEPLNTTSTATRNSSSKAYPVFPPLVRSGRKIDHLVDDVIRKSSRYHAGSLQLSIPPSDFEFYMPSNVSVTGNPTTDARLISSPENRNLAVTATQNVLSAPAMKLIQCGDDCSAFTECHHEKQQENVDEGTIHEVPSFHLGSVTHSEWFDSSSSGSSSMCNSDSYSGYNSDSEQYIEEYDNHEKDEDCDDMFIDS